MSFHCNIWVPIFQVGANHTQAATRSWPFGEETQWDKGQEGQIDICLHIKHWWFQKTATIHHWKGSKALSVQQEIGHSARLLLQENAKAWMTASLYEEWICAWDRELQAKQWKVLLLQDNFSGHIVPDNLQNITLTQTSLQKWHPLLNST